MREDYSYLNRIALNMLSKGYLKSGIPEDLLKDAAIDRLDVMISTAEKQLGFELPTLRYGVKRGWFSPSSPVWSNYGAGRGLPISCNGSYIDDTRDSILFKNAEIGEMTGLGAGTSAYFGAVRGFGQPISSGGYSEGPTHFLRLTQEQITVISQANIRRGNCAVWLPVDHPDIDRWMQIRSISGGVHHPIQHLSFGVCISDKWMNEMLAEPKGGEKRRLMARIRNKRRETGFPYIFFTDNANNNRPEVLKRLNLLIYASNLCTEIMLPSGPNLSFVCNLSSANLLYYHEWKGTNFIRECIYFLDAVMDEYIAKTEGNRLMVDARRFAIEWRALGLGVLGYHSLLQSLMIPYASPEARALNIEIFKYIQEESQAASRHLAVVLGEPIGMKGTGYRNLTLNAIAPTTSSSIICGQVSQSTEPLEGNVFENDNAKGVFIQKNRILEAYLEKIGKNTKKVWENIMMNGGSVKGLTFFSDHEKAVFATFIEIPQTEIIEQTADRQPFIDQGQSTNVKFGAEVSMEEDVGLIIHAWKRGLKSLYYRKGVNKAKELARQNESCVACEA